jgi:hypothetical protein
LYLPSSSLSVVCCFCSTIPEVRLAAALADGIKGGLSDPWPMKYIFQRSHFSEFGHMLALGSGIGNEISHSDLGREALRRFLRVGRIQCFAQHQSEGDASKS